jgi:hypothetical protein
MLGEVVENRKTDEITKYPGDAPFSGLVGVN